MLDELPAPKHKIIIQAPELEDDNEDANAQARRVPEDALDVQARKREAIRQQEEEAFRRSSQAVQRDLPRPFVVESKMLHDAEMTDVEHLIQEELGIVLVHDAEAYPATKKAAGRKRRAQAPAGSYVEYSDELMARARELIEGELKELDHPAPAISAELWNAIQEEFVVSGDGSQVVSASSLNKEQLVASLKREFEVGGDLARCCMFCCMCTSMRF